jgi:hypothetical protein
MTEYSIKALSMFEHMENCVNLQSVSFNTTQDVNFSNENDSGINQSPFYLHFSEEPQNVSGHDSLQREIFKNDLLQTWIEFSNAIDRIPFFKNLDIHFGIFESKRKDTPFIVNLEIGQIKIGYKEESALNTTRIDIIANCLEKIECTLQTLLLYSSNSPFELWGLVFKEEFTYYGTVEARSSAEASVVSNLLYSPLTQNGANYFYTPVSKREKDKLMTDKNHINDFLNLPHHSV